MTLFSNVRRSWRDPLRGFTMEAYSRVAMVSLGVLLSTTRVTAQVPGDSVRIRLDPRTAWITGSIVRADTEAFTLRTAMATREYRFAEVARLDRWKRDNVVVRLVVGTAAGLAGWELGAALNGSSGRITGSRGGDVALGAGVGLLTSAILFAVHPGSWRRCRSAPAAQ